LEKKQNILEKLRAAVVLGDEKMVQGFVREALDSGVDPVEIMDKGLITAIRDVGSKFEKMEIFLTGMMMSADAMKAGMNILLPKIPKDKIQKRGIAVVGTVKGDIHEIGKNILSALLTAASFDVHDLGCDVAASAFVKKAEEVGANIIMASALMTTTLPGQKDILDYMVSVGKRDKYVVLVGGGPTTPEWAEEIGADGYAETAVDGVKLAQSKFEEKWKR
jgi:trimethylamine corrinoid protein